MLKLTLVMSAVPSALWKRKNSYRPGKKKHNVSGIPSKLLAFNLKTHVIVLLYGYHAVHPVILAIPLKKVIIFPLKFVISCESLRT